MNENDHTREAIEYDQGAAVNDEAVEEVNEERGEQDGDEEHRVRMMEENDHKPFLCYVLLQR